MLSFGSESGDTARLEQAAAVLDTPQFREALARELESGAPYPQAADPGHGAVRQRLCRADCLAQ